MGSAGRDLTRRQYGSLAVGALCCAVSGFAAVASLLKSQTELGNKPDYEFESELERLLKGNERFVQGELRHPHLSEDWRKRLSEGQKPFATIVGCSDSRVPPELLFDQGFGDLFVVRVAGNVIDNDVIGSVEYGVDHLATRLVLVMGHEGCGAVTAALQADGVLSKEPNEIKKLVEKIKPYAIRDPSEGDFSLRLQKSVEANVRASVNQLRSVPDLSKAESIGRARIVGCVYAIESGTVRLLDV